MNSFSEDNYYMYEECGFEFPINNDYYNIMNKIIVTSLISIASIALTSWFLGKYLMDNDLMKKNEEKTVLFEDKYSLKDMEHDLSRNNEVTKNTSVIENTPDGLVIMLYNGEREGFEYWCDNKNIKFNYLETVARKFVIMNFCTNLYVDRYDDIKQQQEEYDEIEKKEKMEKNEMEEKEKEEKEKNETGNAKEYDVFVKKKKKKVKKEDRDKIVAKKSNKYLYIGKINEFEWIKKSEEKRIVKEVSFSSFKSIFG